MHHGGTAPNKKKPKYCRKCGRRAMKSTTQLLCWFHYNEYHQKYRKSHLDRIREIHRTSRKKCYHSSPQEKTRTKANRLVRYWREKDRIKSLPCQKCGKKETVAHHDSYAHENWLSIRWLCREHHEKWHRLFIPAYRSEEKPKRVGNDFSSSRRVNKSWKPVPQKSFKCLCLDCSKRFISHVKLLDTVCLACKSIHVTRA